MEKGSKLEPSKRNVISHNLLALLEFTATEGHGV